MNRDFAEMLSALSAAGAEFLVVGAHAMAAHGRPRATGDLDLGGRPTPENAHRVWTAVFQIGLPPCRIDILTEITGVDFDDAVGRPKDLDDVAFLEGRAQERG